MALMRFGHLLGIALWIGGAVAAFTLARAFTASPVGERNVLLGPLAKIHGYVIGPGAVLTVVTGLLWTMSLAQAGMGESLSRPGIIVMQAAGIVAAILSVFVGLPTANRIVRIATTSGADDMEPRIAGLRRRQALVSSVSGVLALVALFAATVVR